MTEPSVLRLNLLRAGYLMLVVGLGSQMWPQLIAEGPVLEVMHGVALSMLCAIGLLSVLGLRYPLRMLPLLFFEMTWKLIWLLRIALPLWAAHRIDAAVASTLSAVLLVAVFPLLVPWSYVARTYLTQPAEPWRTGQTTKITRLALYVFAVGWTHVQPFSLPRALSNSGHSLRLDVRQLTAMANRLINPAALASLAPKASGGAP